MNEPKQKFSASLAKDAVYQQGLRSFMEYRDLGIADATHGKMRAHIVRVKQGGDTHDLHTTGLHKHECDFQMFYVLKGSIKFVYEGQGERTFGPGDCVLQPAGIVHNELECTDDLEILEIYSPAVHPTVVVDKMPETAANHAQDHHRHRRHAAPPDAQGRGRGVSLHQPGVRGDRPVRRHRRGRR
jgi:mannose-6-phosphate isomerase-like protein (cupin superfamily)